WPTRSILPKVACNAPPQRLCDTGKERYFQGTQEPPMRLHLSIAPCGRIQSGGRSPRLVEPAGAGRGLQTRWADLAGSAVRFDSATSLHIFRAGLHGSPPPRDEKAAARGGRPHLSNTLSCRSLVHPHFQDPGVV